MRFEGKVIVKDPNRMPEAYMYIARIREFLEKQEIEHFIYTEIKGAETNG